MRARSLRGFLVLSFAAACSGGDSVAVSPYPAQPWDYGTLEVDAPASTTTRGVEGASLVVVEAGLHDFALVGADDVELRARWRGEVAQLPPSLPVLAFSSSLRDDPRQLEPGFGLRIDSNRSWQSASVSARFDGGRVRGSFRAETSSGDVYEARFDSIYALTCRARAARDASVAAEPDAEDLLDFDEEWGTEFCQNVRETLGPFEEPRND